MPDSRLKIGFTENSVSGRCKAVGGKKILAILQGDYELEQFLHKKFNHHRIVSEYFLYHEEIVNYFVEHTMDSTPCGANHLYANIHLCYACGVAQRETDS